MPNSSISSSSRSSTSDKGFSAKTRGFLRGGIAGGQDQEENSKTGPTTQPSQDIPPQQTSQLSIQQKLDVLEGVLNKVEASKPTQAALPETQVSSGRKEASIEGSTAPSFEQSAGIQYVEEEKTPELSPEVEKYIQEVKQQQQKAPREIVIADVDQDLADQEDYVSEPVIVVPITPEIEKKGKRKPPKFSVRWLVEWSRKIVKMFAGKVVYRQVKG